MAKAPVADSIHHPHLSPPSGILYQRCWTDELHISAEGCGLLQAALCETVKQSMLLDNPVQVEDNMLQVDLQQL